MEGGRRVIQWNGVRPAVSMHTEIGVCAMSIKIVGGLRVNLEQFT